MSQIWHVVRQMSRVWHVVRQMSQVYVTGLACGASDVTGLCHRFGMCASDVTGLACVRQMSCHLMYTAVHCEKPVSRSGTLLNGWCKFHKSRYNSRHHFIMACGVFSGQIIFFM